RGAGDMIDARGSGRRVGAGVGGLGVTGVLIVLALQLLSGGRIEIPAGFDGGVSAQSGSAAYPEATPEEDELAEFTNAVSVNAQDMWTDVFSRAGDRYPRAK